MTRSVELGLKLSEAREALMTLQTAAERDDGAITRGAVRHREAGDAVAGGDARRVRPGRGGLESEGAGDAQIRELVKLEERAEIGAFYDHALNRTHPLDGAELELRQAFAAEDGAIPWAMLAPRPSERQDAELDVLRGAMGTGLGSDADNLQVRVDAAITTPTSVESYQKRIIRRIFARTMPGWLGIRPETVSMGDQVQHVITSGVSPELKAKSGVKDSEAMVLTPTVLNPHDLTAAYSIASSDLARVRGLEAAARADLAGAMASQWEEEILNGAVSPQFAGGLINTLTTPTAAATTVTFATGWEALAGGVDGKYAYTERDVRLLVGTNTYTKFAGLFRGNSSDRSLTAYMQEHGGGIKASAHIPAPSSQ